MSWPVWSVLVFQSKCERVCLFLRRDTTQRCGATKVKVTPSALCIQMCEHPRSLLVTYLHSTLKVKTNQAIWITTAGNFHAFPRHLMSQRCEHRLCIKLPHRAFSIPRVCCAFAAHLFTSTSCAWGKFAIHSGFWVIALKHCHFLFYFGMSCLCSPSPVDLSPSWLPVSTP